MPANKKHLTQSPWQRFAKISAAFIGGLLISICFFTALSFWISDHKVVVSTSVFGLFPLWITLMIVPFLFRNGWKAWMYYLLVILVLCVFIYYGKKVNPIQL